ncbi:MAG TPA: hypothetical protein VII35_15145, partial [Steroidobacteraceae bacterium]
MALLADNEFSKTAAHDGVSFEVNDCEFVAVLWPSGCGAGTVNSLLTPVAFRPGPLTLFLILAPP